MLTNEHLCVKIFTNTDLVFAVYGEFSGVSSLLKKFNLFDLLIIAFVIVIAVISAMVLNTNSGENHENITAQDVGDTVTLRYKIMFEGREKYLADSLVEPDEIFFYDTDDLAGKVVLKETRPHLKDVYDEESQKVVKVEHPEYFDVYLTVESIAEKKDNGLYKIGDSEIHHTKYINFKGKFFNTSGVIYKIEEVKK